MSLVHDTYTVLAIFNGPKFQFLGILNFQSHRKFNFCSIKEIQWPNQKSFARCARCWILKKKIIALIHIEKCECLPKCYWKSSSKVDNFCPKECVPLELDWNLECGQGKQFQKKLQIREKQFILLYTFWSQYSSFVWTKYVVSRMIV